MIQCAFFFLRMGRHAVAVLPPEVESGSDYWNFYLGPLYLPLLEKCVDSRNSSISIRIAVIKECLTKLPNILYNR